MNILLITDNLEGNSGWGRYSLGLAEALKKKNHKVSIVAISNPLKLKKHFLAPWWEALKIYLRYKAHGIEIVHCNVEPYALTSLILARIMGAKLFVTVNGSYAVRFLPHPLYGRLQKMAYRKATKVVAISLFTERKLRKYVPDLDMSVVVPGISPEFIDRGLSMSSKLNLGNQTKIITVAPFKERKGIHTIVRALPKIFRSVPNVTWTLVGRSTDRGYKDELIRYLEKEGVMDRVNLVEGASDDELMRLYSTSSLFALVPKSTEFDFEGFGLVYLEANAFGLPVVGGLGSGAEEAVKDRYSGILVPQDDTDSLASAVIEILESTVLMGEMSTQGLIWAREHSWDIKVSEIIRLYELGDKL